MHNSSRCGKQQDMNQHIQKLFKGLDSNLSLFSLHIKINEDYIYILHILNKISIITNYLVSQPFEYSIPMKRFFCDWKNKVHSYSDQYQYLKQHFKSLIILFLFSSCSMHYICTALTSLSPGLSLSLSSVYL